MKSARNNSRKSKRAERSNENLKKAEKRRVAVAAKKCFSGAIVSIALIST
jgi:hypothetical protein